MKKNRRKAIQLLLIGVLVVAAVFGIYFTYHKEEAFIVVEQPPQVEKDSSIPEEKIEEAEVKKYINMETTIDKLTQEEVITRKIVLASQQVPSRQKPVAVAERKTDEENLPVQEEKKAVVPDTTEQGSGVTLNSAYDTTLNSYVLDVIKTYPIGRYPYLLNNDYANYNGVTTNLYFQNRLLLKAHPSGNKASHCSGITFEVFFKAMQNRNKKLGLSQDDFNGMTYDQLYDFVLTWYVANGNKRANNVAVAVEKYGIGRRITNWEDARAGDFMDISRENNTGHTLVFLNWLRDPNGKIIGFRYWSSQESTRGINYKEEYFNITDANGNKYGNVMADYVFIARVSAMKNYKK